MDLWTDDIKKVSYMSITVHYVDECFVLRDRTHQVKQVRDEKYTASMVPDKFRGGLDAFDFFRFPAKQFIVITDGGSNCSGQSGIHAEYN